MRINQFTDYTLRTLMYVATSKRPVTAREIAETYNISFHHIAKTAQFLAREGYVISKRGREGGIKIARDPAMISIGELVRKTANDSPGLVECMRPGNQCVISPVCKLASALADAQEAFFESLDRITLKDITKNSSDLMNIFEIA